MDRIKKNKLIRKQLDKSLDRLKDMKFSVPPQKGWIRAIREAIGMSGRQLGKRLNVSKQRIHELENEELSGSVTIKTMRKAAEALQCIYIYGLIPHENLEQIVKNRAEYISKRKMKISNQTMMLENQQLSEKETEEMTHSQAEEMVNTLPQSLWDDL